MPTRVAEILKTMEYGPAPESAAPAIGWLDAHARRFGMFIDGEWTAPDEDRLFDSVNPANGQPFAKLTQASEIELDAAVAAARRAFAGWSQASGHTRARYMYALARQIQKHARRLAVLETIDNGKPIRETRDIDIPLVARHFYHHAGWAQLMKTELPGYVPLGVVGQIIPWNFPLLMLAWKIAPALAMGNTVVLKPAEWTSLTALAFAEICQEIGLPPGVVNIVTGDGAVGEMIVKHPGIDKIAFTGSTEVGKLIAKSAADNLTKVSLELGGKAPNIVFADSDLEQAVAGAMMGIFYNQGQVCCAGSRLFVEESVKDQFLEKLSDKAGKIAVGDPMNKSTQMGPQVSEEQLNRIKGYVDIARNEGATVVTGGKTPQLEGAFQKGYFFTPTIFSEVKNNMRVAQEEIFGPVVSVISFKDEDDLIKQANDTIYGLSAGIWTRDITRAHRFAKEIKAGVVWINTYNMFNAASPFGGYKQSGYGREMGRHALDLYTQVKSVWVDLSGRPIGWFGK